jgi:hypothetical protein
MSVPETAEAVLVEEMNRFRGRMCGLIESFGLPERQERGAISTLKSLSYDTQNILSEIIDDLNDRVMRLAADQRAKQQ